MQLYSIYSTSPVTRLWHSWLLCSRSTHIGHRWSKYKLSIQHILPCKWYIATTHDCLDSSMCRYYIPYDNRCSNAFLINLEGNPVSINNLKVDSWLKEDEKAAVNDRVTQLESLLQTDTFVLNWLQKSFFKRFDTSAATTSPIATNSLSSTSFSWRETPSVSRLWCILLYILRCCKICTYWITMT